MNENFSVDLWKLFTDGLPNLCVNFEYRNGADDRMSSQMPIVWKEWDTVTDIVSNVSLSPPYIDYLLWLLWIRKVKFFEKNQQAGMSRNEMFVFFHSVLTLHGIDTDSIDFWNTVVEPLTAKGYLLSTKEDRWTPGMRSGSGWTDVFDVTVKATAVIEKHRSGAESIPQTPIIEMSTADYSYQIQAAADKGVPLIIEAYESDIEDSDGIPANVNISNMSEVEQAVYSATLRANLDAKNPNAKYRYFAMYEKGIMPMQIAKLENPDWESKFGRDEAQRLWASDANRIQKIVERFKKEIAKSTERKVAKT
jgi:hypothetical protein